MFKGRNDKTAKYEQVNGLLDKGCSFEGKLTFDGTVQINGNFQGEVYSDGTLVIGNDANVEANIFVDTLIIYGSVQGSIESKNRVEMHVPAVVVANVKTKTVSIEEGVVFQGGCHMDRPEMNKQPSQKHSKNETPLSTTEGMEGESTDESVFVM